MLYCLFFIAKNWFFLYLCCCEAVSSNTVVPISKLPNGGQTGSYCMV